MEDRVSWSDSLKSEKKEEINRKAFGMALLKVTVEDGVNTVGKAI